MSREDGQMLGRAEIIVPPIDPDKRAKAVRTVAANADDAEDLLMLLDMLELDPREALT